MVLEDEVAVFCIYKKQVGLSYVYILGRRLPAVLHFHYLFNNQL